MKDLSIIQAVRMAESAASFWGQAFILASSDCPEEWEKMEARELIRPCIPTSLARQEWRQFWLTTAKMIVEKLEGGHR